MRSLKALVVGGGIIGASVAWRLARESADVTVLERGRLGREASWAAAGLIAPQGEAQEPGPFFDLCVAGKKAFDSIVDQLTRESGVDPEYDEDGILYVAFDEKTRVELKERVRWQRSAGAVVEELTPGEALKLEPALSPEIIHAIHMPTNRRVENRKLTDAYVNAATKAGARFEEGARVEAIAISNGRAKGVRMFDGTLREADLIVNAAGSWASEIQGLEPDGIRFRPVRGQIVCFETRPGSIGASLFCGDGILVPRRDGRLLAGSVFEEAGFSKSVTLDAMERILRAAKRMVPSLASAITLREAWAGLRPAADDLMPVIGPSPAVPNVIYAAGHFRSGILLSALTGELVADLANDRRPRVDISRFSPARFLKSREVRGK